MSFKKIVAGAVIAAGSLISAGMVHAAMWESIVTGKIARIDSVGGAGGAPNYDLRIYLEGSPKICNGVEGESTWGYVNSNDVNFKGMLAVMLTAYTAGKTVVLHVNKNPAGFCQIGYVIVTG